MPQQLDAATRDTNPQETSAAQDAARIALGLMLVTAGTSHLTFAREPFKAQVPPWVPLDPDTVVLQSGAVEIALGASLLAFPQQKTLLGRVAGAFFVAIFPGNISQWRNHRDAFGLDTDRKRFARLFMQPLLVAWALWSTGALRGTGHKPQRSNQLAESDRRSRWDTPESDLLLTPGSPV